MTDQLAEAIVRFRSIPPERTPQRLDPLGAQSAWALVVLLGAVAVGYGILSTALHGDQLRSPLLAFIALAMLVMTVVIAVVRTHPGHAPIGRWSHLAIAVLAVVSACLFDASVWGRNLRIQDDWGQIAVALLLLVMPLYRPVLEVLLVATASAVVLGVLAALQVPSLAIDNNPLVYTTVAATPILALVAGGCGYAWTMTGETLAWRQIARAGQARLEGELLRTAERMVVQERTTVLNNEAVPFLTALAENGCITEADRERALHIAAAVRTAAVAAVERTWLAETLALALSRRAAASAAAVVPVPVAAAQRVVDPDRLERALSDEQRAIVGALVATVASLPGLSPDSVTITVSEPAHPSFLLAASAVESPRVVRSEFLPFLSALRSTGLTAGIHTADGRFAIHFAYPGSPRQ